MKKGEKRLFFSVLLVLAAALVLLAVQWARGDGAGEIYRVSVLLDASEGDYWKNFKAGLNQAALEQNVDPRFLSRYEAGSTQADVLRREWEGEADGVVVIPTDEQAISAALDDAPAGLAVAVAGPKLPSERVDCYVSPDYGQMGRRLAEAVEALGERECTLFLTPDCGAAAGQTAAALEAALGELGIPCARYTADPGALPEPRPGGALCAVEPGMTEALCQLPAAAGRVCGVGSSGRLLHYLEDGTLSALVVQSDFDAGYTALSQIISLLKRSGAKDAVLESYTATRENMFESPMIDILFPSY